MFYPFSDCHILMLKTGKFTTLPRRYAAGCGIFGTCIQSWKICHSIFVYIHTLWLQSVFTFPVTSCISVTSEYIISIHNIWLVWFVHVVIQVTAGNASYIASSSSLEVSCLMFYLFATTVNCDCLDGVLNRCSVLQDTGS